MSALLHALVALKPVTSSCLFEEEDSDDENVPVTSLLCQWKQPKKRKAASMEVSVAEFKKHEYGKPKNTTQRLLRPMIPVHLKCEVQLAKEYLSC